MKLFKDLPSTDTPINAENLNQIKDKLAVVSATEPTGDNREKVWIQKGKNLFDGKNVLSNNFINGNGDVATSTVTNTTDYIRINPNESYVLSWDVVDGNTRQVVFYDKNKNWISYVQSNTYPFVFETPTNARYLRFSYYNSATEIMLGQGSVAMDYEEYIEPKIYVKNDNDVYEEFISKDDTLEIYSTGEQRIGTWINGKPLYRKVIQATMPEHTGEYGSNTPSTKDISLGIDASFAFCEEVFFVNNSSKEVYELPYLSNDKTAWQKYKLNATTVTLYNNADWANDLPCYIIIKYTKTTD